uniref:Uncharacterized protein n=1 Tax=Oryza meridionalis TaxID=40149 RepID=A0A0E0EJS3_9ORYZ
MPQEIRTKHQKKDIANERPLILSDPMFLKAILPTLNVSSFGFPAGIHWKRQHGNQLQRNNNTIAPVVNALISFNNFGGSTAGQASALDAPQQKLYFRPFSYQGSPPPSMHNHINFPMALPPQVGMDMDKGKTPLIELPYGIPMDNLLVEQTAYSGAGPSIGAPDSVITSYPYIGALNNDGIAGSLMAPPNGPTFSIIEPTVVTQGEGSEKNTVATTRNNAAPLMVPDQVVADVAMDVEDIMFSLESLLGMDYDMLLSMEDANAAADDAAGMDIGWDLDLDDILVENTNDFAFLDNLAGSK